MIGGARGEGRRVFRLVGWFWVMTKGQEEIRAARGGREPRSRERDEID